MAEIIHLDAETTIDEILKVLDQDAAVIIENVISMDAVEALKSDLAPYLSKEAFGRDEFTGFSTKRIGALIARSNACRELALNPLVINVAEQYLNPFADGYQLHFSSAVSIGPGETKQVLHRDRGIWGGYLPRQVEPLMSTIWAVTKFTKENGATQLVPGSHKWDKERKPDDTEIAYAEMNSGSVLLYTGSILHGGGANKTASEIRTGVFLHYALNWLRQEENQYLSCPPSIAKELSTELRSLIGYSKGGYVLGFYSDPYDDEAKFESVSPENMFNKAKDKFESLPNPEELIDETS